MPKRQYEDDNSILSKMFNLIVLCIKKLKITNDDILNPYYQEAFRYMYASLIANEKNVFESIPIINSNIHYYEPVMLIKNKAGGSIISVISWPFIYDVLTRKYYSNLNKKMTIESCTEPKSDILEINFDVTDIDHCDEFYDKYKLSSVILQQLILLYVCAEHAKTHYFLSLTGQSDTLHQQGDYLLSLLSFSPDDDLDDELINNNN